MEKLISIIVPVYNVEKYLDECIKSVLNQTYDNIEILLIDDGSTDTSGAICDQYANMYNNVYVYHKTNGGLSEARNYGLVRAKGEYISFVDSDDYIAPKMIEKLYGLILKYGTQMSCIRHDLVGEKASYTLPLPNGREEVLSAEEMINSIILGLDCRRRLIMYGVQFKLYEKSLLKGMCFPVGKVYEDIVFTTRAVIRAEKCAYLNEALYHYRIRCGSISNKREYDVRLISDKLLMEKKQYKILYKYGLSDSAKLAIARMRDDLIYQLKENAYNPYKYQIKREISTIHPDYVAVIKSEFSIKMKMVFIYHFLYAKIKYGV